MPYQNLYEITNRIDIAERIGQLKEYGCNVVFGKIFAENV